MTTGRDLLRTAVLATNPYWPFTRLNRWPYDAALSILVRTARKRREISNLYIRMNSAQPWIPGLSDIDLTVLLRSGLAADDEYGVLESFWRTCARLQVFPLLGEVQILDEAELGSWLAWTGADPHGPSWRLLYGAANPLVVPGQSRHWRRQALLLAFWMYAVHLPPCLGGSDSWVRRQDIERRVRKIRRTVEPILAEAGRSDLAVSRPDADPAERVAGAVRNLETAITLAAPSPAISGGTRDAGEHVLTTPAGQECIVVEDNLDRRDLADRLRRVWRMRRGPAVPLLLPRRLLAYMLRHVDPKQHGQMSTDVPPPGREEFAAHAMNRIFHLPLFVRGAELFSQPFPMRSLRNQLNSVLAAVLYLREGGIRPYPPRGDERWRGEFPAYAKAFDDIALMAREPLTGEAHRAAFTLVRSILWEARDLMARDTPLGGGPLQPR
jgi:hypothetical protein